MSAIIIDSISSNVLPLKELIIIKCNIHMSDKCGLCTLIQNLHKFINKTYFGIFVQRMNIVIVQFTDYFSVECDQS